MGETPSAKESQVSLDTRDAKRLAVVKGLLFAIYTRARIASSYQAPALFVTNVLLMLRRATTW